LFIIKASDQEKSFTLIFMSVKNHHLADSHKIYKLRSWVQNIAVILVTNFQMK